MPARVFGDLRAQLAACHIAEAAFLRLVARHGAKQVQAYMDEILDYTERLTRASLSELPDGEWSFEDWIDDDGIDYGKPIRLFVTLRKRGRLARGRLDGHVAAGQGRHQQHGVVHEGGDLHVPQVRPRARRARATRASTVPST